MGDFDKSPMIVKTTEIKKAHKKSKKYIETFIERTCSHNLETIVQASNYLEDIYVKYENLEFIRELYIEREESGRCYWVCVEPSGNIVRIFIGITHKVCEEPL
jgi:hypothetical protein